MKSGSRIIFGLWIIILFNVLFSCVAMWMFWRMAPGLKSVYRRNASSLEQGEHMLAAVAYDKINIAMFEEAYNKARENITETGESELLKQIGAHIPAMKQEGFNNKSEVIKLILAFDQKNRDAMVSAAAEARSLGRAGAWTIAFMGLCFYIFALSFVRHVNRSIFSPLSELIESLRAVRNGDIYRRCSGIDLSADMKEIFGSVNDLFDNQKRS